MEVRLRAVIGFALAAALAVAAPTAATPPVSHREQNLARIERGELEAGRAALRKELEQYRVLWRQAELGSGPEGLGHRVAYAGELRAILLGWYTAEARALHEGNAADAASALAVLDELLPLAREVEQVRAGYRAEADALEGTLEPMERQRKYAWVFDSARFDDHDALPWSAARLGKLCDSEVHVERVFDSFGGRVGDQRDPLAYFRAHEDFDFTLGRSRDARRRAAERASQEVVIEEPAASDEDEEAIRQLLARYYDAVVGGDADAVRSCLSEGMTQAEAILTGLQTTKTLRVGKIEALSLESGQGEAVRVTVEKVPITFRRAGEEVTAEGSQGFVVVKDGAGAWKILEVGR